MSEILCCVFNYNLNENAERWLDFLSLHYDTCVLDSGSKVKNPRFRLYPNIYYTGMYNEACRLCLEGEYRWLMIITSDITIDADNSLRLVERIETIAKTLNVGLYQPSCDASSRSLNGKHIGNGELRHTAWQEGYFHLINRAVVEAVPFIDPTINQIGCGIDSVLAHKCSLLRRLILIDDSVVIHHPKDKGYNAHKGRVQNRAMQQAMGLTGDYTMVDDEILYANN
ncbi:MAG: hypothetical protein SOZ00_05005 [Tidjanibacter sp.]|nr:hypothetical protein [Tidjanibacter sp.]